VRALYEVVGSPAVDVDCLRIHIVQDVIPHIVPSVPLPCSWACVCCAVLCAGRRAGVLAELVSVAMVDVM